MTGWIKLYRKLLSSPMIEHPHVISLWVYLLLKATHTECKIISGNQVVDLLPGQLIFGRKKASIDLKMSEKVIRGAMKLLINLDSISIVRKTSKYSIYAIENWDKYQQSDRKEEATNEQKNIEKFPESGRQRAVNGPSQPIDNTEEYGGNEKTRAVKGPTKGQQRANKGPTKGHIQEGKEGKEGKQPPLPPKGEIEKNDRPCESTAENSTESTHEIAGQAAYEEIMPDGIAKVPIDSSGATNESQVDIPNLCVPLIKQCRARELEELIGYLNAKTGKKFKPVKSNVTLLSARLNEGHTPVDIRAVIDRKTLEWKNNPLMAQYLRPATLFNAQKFNQYVGELDQPLPPTGAENATNQNPTSRAARHAAAVAAGRAMHEQAVADGLANGDLQSTVDAVWSPIH